MSSASSSLLNPIFYYVVFELLKAEIWTNKVSTFFSSTHWKYLSFCLSIYFPIYFLILLCTFLPTLFPSFFPSLTSLSSLTSFLDFLSSLSPFFLQLFLHFKFSIVQCNYGSMREREQVRWRFKIIFSYEGF